MAFLNWIADQGWKVDAESGKGDVSVVRTDNKITPDAYKSGSIDGAWVPEPTASKLVAEGAKVLLDEADLWPDKKFVITNIIVSQKFLKEHPKVVEAVLTGAVKTNAWINANPDKAKAAASAQLKIDSGKALKPEAIDPAWKSIQFTNDPLGFHPQHGGVARGRGRPAGEAGPGGHLRPHAPEQGPHSPRVRPPFPDAGLGVKQARIPISSQEVTTMATALAQSADTTSVEHAARIDHVSKSFAGPSGSSSSSTTSPSMSRRASSSPSWGPRAAESRRCSIWSRGSTPRARAASRPTGDRP